MTRPSISPAAVASHEGYGCHTCETSHGVELITWCGSCDRPLCSFCMVEVVVVERRVMICPACVGEAEADGEQP